MGACVIAKQLRRRPFEHTAPSVLLPLLIGLALTLGCENSDEVVTFTFWSWSEGAREGHLEELETRFNAAQERVKVSRSQWPGELRAMKTTTALANALLSMEIDEEAPALLEVPEESLPALVEAELVRDIGGRFAKRLGVRFDDFQPWLLSTARVRAEGILALPLFHEAPLFVVKRGVSAGDVLRERGLLGLLALNEDQTETSSRSFHVPRDHRILLALFKANAAIEYNESEERYVLHREKVRQSLEQYSQLVGEGAAASEPLPIQELAGMLSSEERQAGLVWSSAIAETSDDAVAVLRAPMRTKGTSLVVFKRAPWRERQAAFRFARWVTEPLQGAEIARRFWVVPPRRSAAESARYRGAPGSRDWRREVAEGSDILCLPPSGRFLDEVTRMTETTRASYELSESDFERLQRSLTATDD